MGDQTRMYRAVIFNPVPGPPMAGNTRLSFRYWLKGTGTLRCQIYSLSKGYPRHLLLKGLPQERWQSATVDMTQARRPDGSGGPLAKDERIDDIQFYVNPSEEVLIDEIVLYEPTLEGEKRPFPRRILFTGWFDTGKQGAGHEWPGDFDIVLHEKPLTWDAAKAVLDAKTGTPWIRVNMRGTRELSERNRLRFRYNCSAKKICVGIRNAASNKVWEQVLMVSKQSVRQTAMMNFGGAGGSHATDVIFRVAKESSLLVDDLLLYEPSD